MEDIIAQLIKIYMTEEWWHKNKLSLEESWKYFRYLLTQGNILYKDKDGEVVGYVEFFFVTPGQLDVLDSDGEFAIPEENITDGDICYINNLWIKEGHRGNGMLASFKSKIDKIKDFKYYSGNDVKDNNSFKIRRK